MASVSGMKRSRSTAHMQADAEQAQQEKPSISLASLPVSAQEYTSGISATSSARSSLFGEPSTNASVLAPATQFPSNNHTDNKDLNYNAKQPNGPASSSLFGAVMKNLASNTNKLSTLSEEHSTPAKPVRGNYKHGISPGGFQLQDVINGFGNSPFCYNKSSRFGTPASTSTTNSSQQSSLDSSPHRTLEWHECAVDSHTLHFIDWTIQSALELEYSPAVLRHVDASVQHQALCQFVAIANRQPPQQHCRERAAALAWEASLLYWQHPSTYPLPPHNSDSSSLTKSNTNLRKSGRKGKHLIVQKSASLSNSAVGSNSSTMPPPSRMSSASGSQQAFASAARNQTLANGMTGPTASSYLETRAQEWQEAFRSLYLSWTEQIRQLNCHQMIARLEDDGLLVKLISDLYFYATGKGHTVLFRVGVERRDTSSHTEHAKEDSQPMPWRFVPEILLSSSTLELRDKLRSMGVQLSLLDSWHGLKRGAFEEEDLTQSLKPFGTSVKEQQPHSSPSVQAELVALRRAQVFGQTVGADVSVRVHSKASGFHNLPSRSPKRIPPLCMTGLDDCGAFFKIYYNTFGDIGAVNIQHHSKANELMHDVPLLLCRKLGPFLHSTVKTVRSTVRKSKKNELSASTVLDLQGYILPCAVRDLICASVDVLLADQASLEVEGELSDTTTAEENIVGTHHFAIKPTPYSGEEADGNIPLGTIGSHSSKGMNGDYSLLHHPYDVSGTHYCRHDEILQLAVWDLQRQNSLAYKLEHVSTNEFSSTR